MATLGSGKHVLRHLKSPWSTAIKPIATKPTVKPKFGPLTRNYATYPPTKYRSPIQPVEGYTRFQHNQKVPFYKSKRLLLFMGTGTVMFGGYYVTHLEKVPISSRTRFMSITPRQEEGNKHNLSYSY
jgi:hypothetical protein